MDRLGRAFSLYRDRIYGAGSSDTEAVPANAILEMCELGIGKIDDTIRHSRRNDGLYHSYNLVRFSDDLSEAAVLHLQEMLEGQVAVLDSGVLSAGERSAVIDALYESAMYRADQRSFMLYPDRELPSFLEKNVVPRSAVEGNDLLSCLMAAGDDSVVTADVDGNLRFNADFGNRTELVAALDRLATDQAWCDLVDTHREATLQTYEEVFRHHFYTGRSGSMYAYEGIGSIYWHMVAKLLVAVQEAACWAVETGAASEEVEELVSGYWRIRSGLGFNKSAKEFGAIPLDPYSHTPAHTGAQQPGMTGLVKEELLTRWLEMGVRVSDGEIRFEPLFLRPDELLGQPSVWRVLDANLGSHEIALDEGTLGFTLCQVPFIVSMDTEEPFVEIFLSDGGSHREAGPAVPRSFSEKVFTRAGDIERIEAHFSRS